MEPRLTAKERHDGEQHIKRIITAYQLTVLDVYRNGPRFFVAACQMGDRRVIFKMCFKSPKTDPFPNHGLKKEALLLSYFSQRDPRFFQGRTGRIYAYGLIGRRWYIREQLSGEVQNIKDSNFIFKPSFFTAGTIRWYTTFFGRVHRLSHRFPPHLRRVYTGHNLETNMALIGWYKLPQLIDSPQIIERTQRFLLERSRIFDTNQNALTHYEPYASHFFKHGPNKFFIIDWENVDWGTAAHDLSVLWCRGRLHPAWQKALLRSFYRQTLFKKHFWELFTVEVLLQSINNIDYFILTTNPTEKKYAVKALPFFRKVVLNILAGKFHPY